MNIISSRVYYKNPDGGVTKRLAEHFWKRRVEYEINNERKSIEILNDDLGLDATVDDIEAYLSSL